MRLDAAQRIGAGEDDGAIVRVRIVVEGDRLELQRRRPQHLDPPGAQGPGRGFIVGIRAGHKNGHASNSDEVPKYRIAAATRDCRSGPRNATGIGKRRFGG